MSDVKNTLHLFSQIVTSGARSIPARGESVELLPSIFKLAGSDLTLSRREVLQENRRVFLQSKVGTDTHKKNHSRFPSKVVISRNIAQEKLSPRNDSSTPK